jgi:hypothetical protein
LALVVSVEVLLKRVALLEQIPSLVLLLPLVVDMEQAMAQVALVVMEALAEAVAVMVVMLVEFHLQ